MAIALSIAAVLLVVIGLAVRTAGSSRVLNFIDYAKTADVPALHAWVGVRLMLLGVSAGVLAALAWRSPTYAAIYVVAFFFLLIAALGMVMTGASHFQRQK